MSAVASITRLNLGCGHYPLEGWTNVDADTDAPADVWADFTHWEFCFRDIAEVNMSHVLEHISWREVPALLERIHGWMRPGGEITIEVPDMEAIMALGCVHPLWFKYVFGDQSHDGEYHRSGFTAKMLAAELQRSGWSLIYVRQFTSTHKGREGMPCLLAEAVA